MSDEVPNLFDLKVVETASLEQVQAALKVLNRNLTEGQKKKKFEELLKEANANDNTE